MPKPKRRWLKNKVHAGKRRRVKARSSGDLIAQCGDILRKLASHKYSWPFMEPVDVIKLDLPDYHQIITKPMDLGTVKNKLTRKLYTSPLQFAEDVRLTFANAMEYNPKDQDVHIMASVLSEVFESKWKLLAPKLEEVVDGEGHPDEVVIQVNLAMPWEAEASSDVSHLTPTVPSKFQAFTDRLEGANQQQADWLLKLLRRKNINVQIVDGIPTLELATLDSATLQEMHDLIAGSTEKQVTSHPGYFQEDADNLSAVGYLITTEDSVSSSNIDSDDADSSSVTEM